MSDYRRIHFISDFVVYDPSHEPKLYECKRCGEQILGELGCYTHRQGLLSECRLNRFRDFVRGDDL